MNSRNLNLGKDNNMNNKKIVIANNTSSKNFSYQKGNCRLNFSLRNDIKGELKDFLELLKIAQEDVEKEIKTL